MVETIPSADPDAVRSRLLASLPGLTQARVIVAPRPETPAGF